MFLPALPSWTTVKLGLMAAAIVAAFSGGVWVTNQYHDAQENKAWQFQVDGLKAQADKDRTKLAERDKRLAEIDNEATKWRQRYRDLKRADPVVQAWADTPHPPAVGLLLNGSVDLSSDSNSRP